MTQPESRRLTLAEAAAHLASQPFSVLLATRLTSFGPDQTILEVDVREDLLQQNGFLHGGVLAYAADNALTYAGGAALGPAVLTGGMSIEYLRPALGITLRATARIRHVGKCRTICGCDLEMIDDTGKMRLCAVAQGTVHSV
ncbi:PaaI family thioesterase [Gordonia sp. MP11Mi]|uniref:PaaI family thioesterase n=1 Tax=Gordonia sp. MP11Mi TaxID=3022769 RepID=UPI003B636A78